MKSDPINEDLLNQTRVFYYQTCKNAGVIPIQANKSLSEVQARFILLKSSKGNTVIIRYTKNFLFLELNGTEYNTMISFHKKRIKSTYTLYIETNLLTTFRK